ncbi:MAG: ABC transporter substrate-binding protein [Bacillota bacterium]|nr:ABC transporter substrate-binding protein [Bacillota bacterium]
MKRFLILILALSLMLTMLGCSKDQGEEVSATNERADTASLNEENTSGNNDYVTVTDMLGRQVKIKKPIERIIVNHWDLGEVVSMVVGPEYENILVGVGGSGSAAEFQKVYGKALPGLQDMAVISASGNSSYDLEMIIKLQPDVFFINSSGSYLENAKKQVEDLEKAGIPVFFFTFGQDVINSPQEGIRLLGQVFEKEARAKEITDFIDRQFDLVDSRLEGLEDEDRPRVYYEHSRGADINSYGSTNIKGGWATIIEKAKGKNIGKDSLMENNQIDPEYLLKVDPDFIFFSTGLGYKDASTDKTPELINKLVQRLGWEDLKAVKNKEVHAMFHDHSRSAFAFYPTLYMAKNFYPDLMEDLDSDQILKEFYDKFLLVDYEDGLWSYKLD